MLFPHLILFPFDHEASLCRLFDASLSVRTTEVVGVTQNSEVETRLYGDPRFNPQGRLRKHEYR